MRSILDLRTCRRILPLGLILALLAGSLALLAGCESSDGEKTKVANYGTYGSNLAQKLATQFPNRSPGSDQEKAAGDFLVQCFKDLGYQPTVTEFSYKDGTGDHASRNIAVLIKGQGFTATDKDGQTASVRRQVIIGAHYDTSITAAMAAKEPKPTAAAKPAGNAGSVSAGIREPVLSEADGINDNASGVGALLTIAREMKSARLGYDVILVAFGAGTAAQAGSRYFTSQMTAADAAGTDAMYCLDSIYAGDKVYAHAGLNSLKAGYQKDYEKRRKLYEVTDVFYEYELYTANNYMLYTNQSAIDVTVPGIEGPVLYREWSQNISDDAPFDELGIPIVFFESYDYDEKTLEAMKESQNPAFGSTGGKISGTRFDSSAYLAQLLNSTARTVTVTGAASQATVDLLTKRINNTAFIILEAVRKGMNGATAN